MIRRDFLGGMAAAAVRAGARDHNRPPNVVLIVTDDQAYGDVHICGNETISTPNMDRIGGQGVQFTQFHVSPVCSPTRASLMTGRYNYRTGVIDTYLGRSLLDPREQTLPQALSEAGYRTGIFGKWHLGDNYPMRAMDRGFHEAVVLKGGGLRQPSDPPGSGGYFDPILMHNGKPQRYHGYCADIYTDEALQFIEFHRARPFLAYLATNTPHAPLLIDESWVEPYRKMGLPDLNARIYGMVANMDWNIGRVLRKLAELRLERNTIVVFMSDNGPDIGPEKLRRFNAGMRDIKGTVYEGGIRVPFFMRWPGVVKPRSIVDRLAAHIDLMPTLLEACDVPRPTGVAFDGRSLMPLLRNPQAEWPDRTLFFQWHRGDVPELYRACAVRTQRWKLVDGKELYDLESDPGESRDVSGAHREIVGRLRREYEAWFRDVSSTRGYDPPRIKIGTLQENPVVLTRLDWRGPRAGWAKTSLGYWEVEVVQSGPYRVSVVMAPAEDDGETRFLLNGVSSSKAMKKGDTACDLGVLDIPAGPGRATAMVASGQREPVGVHFLELQSMRLTPPHLRTQQPRRSTTAFGERYAKPIL